MAGAEAVAGQGHDRHPHPERLADREPAGIGEGVEGDVDPAIGGEQRLMRHAAFQRHAIRRQPRARQARLHAVARRRLAQRMGAEDEAVARARPPGCGPRRAAPAASPWPGCLYGRRLCKHHEAFYVADHAPRRHRLRPRSPVLPAVSPGQHRRANRRQRPGSTGTQSSRRRDRQGDWAAPSPRPSSTTAYRVSVAPMRSRDNWPDC